MKIAALMFVAMVMALGLVRVSGSAKLGPREGYRSAAVPDAAQSYSQNCAKCHGQDGRASGFKAKLIHARNLTDPQWQDSVTDERIFNSIENGKGKMPAFGKKLTEAQVNDLVTYVRRLKK